MSDSVEPRTWSRRQWWSLIALVLAAQFSLIFWLGRRETPPSIPTDIAPGLRLVGDGAAEELALIDPTLLALPHREGFSGPAWLTMPVVEGPHYEWSEPPRWLELSLDRLGSDFKNFMVTNDRSALPVLASPELQLLQPSVSTSPAFPDHSTMRLLGELAFRRLLTQPTLPSFTNADILTNNVVQLLVDANGKPISAVLLNNTGSPEADSRATRVALDLRFEPFGSSPPLNPAANLTLGHVVFEWHTLPPSATNTPAATPGAQ